MQKINFFPKDFFTRERPIITNKEALKDVIPPKLNKLSKISCVLKKCKRQKSV